MPHILQVNQLKQWTCPQSPGLQTTGWKLTLHLLGTHHYFLQPWRMLLGFLRVIQRDYTRKRTVPMETTENMFTICSDMWYLSSILSSEISNIYAIDQFQVMWHNKSRCRGPWHTASHSTETALASISSVLLTHVHREESPGGPPSRDPVSSRSGAGLRTWVSTAEPGVPDAVSVQPDFE